MSNQIIYNPETIEIYTPAQLRTLVNADMTKKALVAWLAEHDEEINTKWARTAAAGGNADFLEIPKLLVEPETNLTISLDPNSLIKNLKTLTDTTEGNGETIFLGYHFNPEIIDIIEDIYQIEISWSIDNPFSTINEETTT